MSAVVTSDPESTPLSATEAALHGLKDFQRRTVDYVFDRLYGPGSSGRFLVADEVGLGKTMIARGVIARAIEHLRPTVPRIDVLYICSNGDIARQNLERLRPGTEKHLTIASRLTMLPLEVGRLRNPPGGVNFISFTPATSFELQDGLGQAYERCLLYWMLHDEWKLASSKGAVAAFRGHVGEDRFKAMLGGFDRCRIDAHALQCFVDVVRRRSQEDHAAGRRDLEARFQDVCRGYASSKGGGDLGRERNAVIGTLRALLAESCVDPLEPDLVILDEFQRFSDLLHGEDDASTLARAVLRYPNVKVLLLSATPYKMYTLDDAEGDDHYRDFVRTVRFLEGDTKPAEPLPALLTQYRDALFAMTQADGLDRLRDVRGRLESRLRKVIVRTERLASTPDRNGMLKEVPASSSSCTLSANDVLDFVAVQRVARELGQSDATEYWKSAPYVLNFLDDGYKLKTELREALETADSRQRVARALSASSTATLRWDQVSSYAALDPGNARMRWLVQDIIESGAYRLLWVPPSLPYYRSAGPFAQPSVQRFTKRLVFSSWRVVPRAISALLSYEVERRTLGSESDSTYAARSERRGVLVFSESRGRLTGMPVLALLYPSIYLAEACDPAKLALEAASDQGATSASAATLEDVLQLARDRIEVAVEKYLPRPAEEGPVDERWYWAAPLLLDQKLQGGPTRAWFEQEHLASAWCGGDLDSDDDDAARSSERSAWAKHVEAAREVALGGASSVTSAQGTSALGRMPEDLVEVLALLAVGGPAVTMFRAFLHVFDGGKALDERARVVVRDAAGRTAWAFRALFNQPEVMAMLRPATAEVPYWRAVLEYCAQGNIQAMLDEYVHVLRDQAGLFSGSIAERVMKLAQEVEDAIELRTSRVGIDDITPSDSGRTIVRAKEGRNLRTHFALRFGDEKSEDGATMTRADQVRKAFNSPFWPFVVATTSVGQEGLDFHLYCHAVVHWNLPPNPVDFEQREGRVHRYKGHAVRKNIAQVHGEAALQTGDRDRWETAFRFARDARAADATDVVPYWVYSEGDARIERHVPALPLSRDQERAARLRGSLAVYRMVFGQPRQEDLVAYLLERVSREELNATVTEMRIRLDPDVQALANKGFFSL